MPHHIGGGVMSPAITEWPLATVRRLRAEEDQS